jgi:hypothetical protein
MGLQETSIQCLVGVNVEIMRETPSLPQRGRLPKGSTPRPPFFGIFKVNLRKKTS